MARSHRVAVALAVVLVGALPAAAAVDPGITPTRILLGTTASSGSDQAAVARGLAAYLAYVSARGGVHGRSIVLRVADDAADPVVATRRLVEADHVFAVVGQGSGDASVAIRAYLNRARVPQLFGSSSAVSPRFPWTIGYRPSLRAEGRIYGRFLARTRAQARVSVLAGDGADGAELLAGLRAGVAGSTARVVAVERVDDEGLDAARQVAALRASGADTLAVFAEPPAAARVFAAAARLGWRPATVTDSRSGAGPVKPPAGTISASFVKRPTEPRWAADPGMRLYRSILARYAPGARAADVLHLHGMAIAHTTVEVLRAAGPEPTRAAALAKARSLRSAANPFVLPGVTVRTSPTDGVPVEELTLERWNGRAWSAFGGLWG